MNFSQININQLNLSPLSLIALGLGVVFALYVLVKLIQWARNRSRSALTTHKMRPQGASRVPEDSIPVGDTQKLPKVSAQVSSQPTSNINSTEPLHASEVVMAPRKYATTTLWPMEPKTFVKRNHFEESGEEYPWADGSDYAFGSATSIMSELLPESEKSRHALTKSLRNAGYYSPHAWQNLSAVRYLGMILPIIICGSLLVIVPEFLESYLIAGLVIGPMLGWALPTLYVRSRAAERLREIENSMPDMMDLLNMCVAQGMTVPASLRRVSQDMVNVYPALAKELTIVAEQARVGHLTEALTNFSDRVDAPEVHSFTSLLIQTEQMGTSVSEALEEYSDNIRESQRQRADQKANAATFKLLFPTVLCLMPAVFLFLMGPALIELNEFFENGGLKGLDQGASQAIEAQR